MVAVTVAVSGWDVFTPTVVDGARTAADSTCIQHQTRSVVVGRGRFVVACVVIRAAWNFIAVTDSVRIDIPRAVTAADAEGVELVAIAVAVASGNVLTPTVVDGTRPVADPAVVIAADAVIDIVTQTITVRICRAVPTADTEGVELVAIAVTFSGGDALTPAVVDGAWPVADPAIVIAADAVIDIVTEAVAVEVS